MLTGQIADIFSEEEKKLFKDPVYYKQFRQSLESELNVSCRLALHFLCTIWSDDCPVNDCVNSQYIRVPCETAPCKRVRGRPSEQTCWKGWPRSHGSPITVSTVTSVLKYPHLKRNNFVVIPDFAVACRRLTPGPGYLEALCEDNVHIRYITFTYQKHSTLVPQVEFVPTHIRRVTSKGIELINGEHQDLDVLICATGYDTTYLYPFPILGVDSTPLTSKWQPYPQTYLSICVDDFPNWFFSLGPNSAVGSGSLLALIEAEVDYAVQVALKMQRERIKRIMVRREAVEDYEEYIEVS